MTKKEQKIVDDYKTLSGLNIKSDNYSIYKSFNDKSKEAILLYTVMTKSDLGLRYFSLDGSIKITGDDLKQMGILPSKKYSECFDYILKHKLENPDLTKEEELALAKEFFG